jgi:transcription elongation factor GreA
LPIDDYPMTAAGHAALERELSQRTGVERPRLIQRIQEAIADDTNLAENSEYQAAKTDQKINEAKIPKFRDGPC